MLGSIGRYRSEHLGITAGGIVSSPACLMHMHAFACSWQSAVNVWTML